MQARVRAFRSIRNRILVFSILVTMLPSLGIGWYWFDLTHKATSEKVEQKLLDSASFAEREVNLWLEERSFDLRAFANSPLVLESFRSTIPEGKKDPKQVAIKTSSHLRKLSSYLTLVRDQYRDYRRLMILDGNGAIIATSGRDDSDHPLSLPDNWKEQAAELRLFSSDAFSVEGEAAPLLLLGIPLFAEQNSPPLGFFAMEVRLQSIPQLLKNSLPLSGAGKDPYAISLFSMNGEPIVSTALPADKSATLISPQETIGLFAVPRLLKEFVNERRERVVGVSIPLRHPSWHLLVTERYDTIFSGLMQNRNRILLIAVLLTVVIGGIATIIASQIINPLQDLTKGVLRVADGDLDVAVAIHRQDELGLVTEMFNTMISRLKENQQKLELLATTDFLTGLAIRKQIMTDLAQEVEQYRRHGTKFSLLMVDIDHFKTVNDTHGHLVGDAVLKQLARIFQKTLRILDSAGRYGGEEFLIVLGQTDLLQALQIAERIRLAVQQHIFTCEEVTLQATISIGVAEMSTQDMTINELIDRADQALYNAKKQGRNRVVSS